jgi:hypothetical protein
MFDVQLQGSLALSDGKIAEMQTGEGHPCNDRERLPGPAGCQMDGPDL